MIEPATYNITCPNNATFELYFVWAVDGVPVNNTGGICSLQVRPTYSAVTPLFDLEVGAGITLGGASGAVTCTIDEAVTATVPPGNYVYDLVLTISGTAYRLLQGKWQHMSGVSR